MSRAKDRIAFCEDELRRYGTACGMKPSQIAEDFIAFFNVSELPRLEEMCAVAGTYGFGAPEARALPEGLRAFHHRLPSGDYELLYQEGMYTGTQLFSVLHDMFEEICETFADLDTDYVCPTSPGPLCQQANRFAALVAMQPHMVRSALQETGFDLIELHYRLGQAYTAVAIRAVEVLDDCGGTPVYVAVFEDTDWMEPGDGLPLTDTGNFRVTVARGTKSLLGTPKRWRGKALMPPHAFLPRRKDGVREGSIVADAIRMGGPVLLERVTGLDFWMDRELVFLARPVRWYGKVSKVVLLGVHRADVGLLERQIARSKPWVKTESFQRV